MVGGCSSSSWGYDGELVAEYYDGGCISAGCDVDGYAGHDVVAYQPVAVVSYWWEY